MEADKVLTPERNGVEISKEHPQYYKEAEWEGLQAMVDGALQALVADPSQEMKERLFQKMREGFTGWNDPAELKALAQRATDVVSFLAFEILEPSDRIPRDLDWKNRQIIDGMNFLAMIYNILNRSGTGKGGEQ